MSRIEVFRHPEDYSLEAPTWEHDGWPYEPGWYYWYIQPGCLPDSKKPIGPFDSKADALENGNGRRMAMPYCPFCGKDNPCESASCLEAQTRVPLAKKNRHGVPQLRKGWLSQEENQRIRRQKKLRMLPDAIKRVERYAAERGASFCDVVEAWALSLPESTPPREP